MILYTINDISNITTIDMSFQEVKQNTHLIQESDLKMSFVTQTGPFFTHTNEMVLLF